MKHPLLSVIGLGAIVALASPFPCLGQTEPVPFPAAEPGVPEPDSRLPQLVTRVAPEYPAALRTRRPEADVYVAFVVDEHGKPTRVRAFFSHFDEMEAPAVAAVRQWTFTGGVHLGRPAKTQMIVAVHFAPPAGGS